MINNDLKNNIYNDLKKFIPTFALFYVVIFLIRKIFSTVCYFRILFGIPCPACGISRAFSLILKGHFILAFKMHPMIYFVIFWCLLFIIQRYFNNNLSSIFKFYTIICIILFIVIYVYRMVIMYPNVYPMIYNNNNLLHNLTNLLKL